MVKYQDKTNDNYVIGEIKLLTLIFEDGFFWHINQVYECSEGADSSDTPNWITFKVALPTYNVNLRDLMEKKLIAIDMQCDRFELSSSDRLPTYISYLCEMRLTEYSLMHYSDDNHGYEMTFKGKIID